MNEPIITKAPILFECTDPLHTYVLEGNQTINFIKRSNGELINQGTTNETLLEVLLDRTRGLDERFPCIENKDAIAHMEQALNSFYSRTAKRVSQGVETKDQAHLS